MQFLSLFYPIIDLLIYFKNKNPVLKSVKVTKRENREIQVFIISLEK